MEKSRNGLSNWDLYTSKGHVLWRKLTGCAEMYNVAAALLSELMRKTNIFMKTFEKLLTLVYKCSMLNI